ncbi:MAG: DUF1761 domain-containing protein [Patescibacteria group bacterium]
MIDINYLAVIAAAVGNMIVGSLWYGPVFGKYWMRLNGFTPESMNAMHLKVWQAMIGGAITALLMAFVLSHVAIAFMAADLMGALQLAFWMWLGFTAVTIAEGFLWEGRSFELFVLNAARSLVTLLIMASIIVLWPW